MKRPFSTGMSVRSREPAQRRLQHVMTGERRATVGRRGVTPVGHPPPERRVQAGQQFDDQARLIRVERMQSVGELAGVERRDPRGPARIGLSPDRMRIRTTWEHRSTPATTPGRSASRSPRGLPISPISRVAAVSAAILTKTESGTPSPVNASRARDDVPASPPIRDTDATVRPMICEGTAASRSWIVRGSGSEAADRPRRSRSASFRGRDVRPGRASALPDSLSGPPATS